MLDLNIIILSWNTEILTLQCLTSIFKYTKNIDFAVWVVDNNSIDGSVEMIKKHFPKVNLVTNKENFGFSKANNQAIRKAEDSRYFLLLNSDTEIKNNVFAEIIKYADKHPNLGIVGPTILNADHTLQHSVRHFPDLDSQLLIMTKLSLFFPGAKSLEKYYDKYFNYHKSQNVDQVMGACFLIREELINTIGLLDEKFWFWFEEVDYCYRAKKAGFDVGFWHDGHVIHHGGKSAEQMMRFDRQKNFNRSLLYYFYKNQPWTEFFILWIFKPFSMLAVKLMGLIVKEK